MSIEMRSPGAATPLSRNEAAGQLSALGVTAGGVLLVHTAFSKLAPIDGGPRGLIDALLATIGPHGTLVMPSMSDDDEIPFDAARTPCVENMGIVADTFWRMPGVLRSDNPHAFAAMGPRAAEIVAAHPLDVPHGLDSPAGRVYGMDGQVLLLGVGHDANTTVHLAENMTGMRYLRPKHLTVLRDGRPEKLEYFELDHCCQGFSLLDDWLEAEGKQRRGRVGHGEARLMRSCDVVDAAMPRLREDETVFLHPPGSCEECDDARNALQTVKP
jgi:aminoglycoside 3-N-acetyltransferase